MKLEINRFGLQGAPSQVNLEHRGVVLEWNIALFDKASFNGEFDIFEQINGYWGHLAMEVQDKIFNVYQRIKDVFDSVWENSELTKQLYQLIKELYVHHQLSDIKFWISFRSNVVVPAGLREEFKESHETPGTRERTYLKADYEWLVALSVALRPMVPIWGEFINRTRRDAGTVFKEYYAFQLLAYSSLYNSEPMERLRVYVEHSLPAEKSKAAAIFGGISSEDFPMWVLGLVVVRRLSIGDVRGTDPGTTLVSFIYKYIGQKVKGHDNNFIGMVKDKQVEGQGQEGENNLSKLEGYKIKQEIPAGDIAIIEYRARQPLHLAKKLCPDISEELVKESIATVTAALQNSTIFNPQMTMVQWVMAGVLPPRGLLHLKKTTVLMVMGVVQAILWHKGHRELAGLMTALEQDSDDEMLLGGTDSRARIPKDMLEQLDALFPYSRRPTGKMRQVKRTNAAIETIEELNKGFGSNVWRLTLPAAWVEQVTGNKNNRRYSTPHDIKVKLAALAIQLAQRTF